MLKIGVGRIMQLEKRFKKLSQFRNDKILTHLFFSSGYLFVMTNIIIVGNMAGQLKHNNMSPITKERKIKVTILISCTFCQ